MFIAHIRRQRLPEYPVGKRIRREKLYDPFKKSMSGIKEAVSGTVNRYPYRNLLILLRWKQFTVP
jgi:hypothetical protein